MGEHEARIVAITVAPKGEGVLSEQATRIEYIDEGAGEFVEVSQVIGGKIGIDPKEWPHIRDAIDKMIGGCRDY